MNKTLAIMLAAAFAVAALTTTTISLGAATPTFADQKCSTTGTIETCIGGSSAKHLGALDDTRGGSGVRGVFDSSTGESTFSGGRGLKTDDDGSVFIGGEGGHQTCGGFHDCTVGGINGKGGIHEKGPGGNSDK